MSKLIKDNAPFLQLLLHITSKAQRKSLLNSITNEQVKVLSEIAHNLLQGTIPFNTVQKVKLKKYKSFIRLLGNTSVAIKAKKQNISKKGSVIALLLLTAEPTLKKIWKK